MALFVVPWSLDVTLQVSHKHWGWIAYGQMGSHCDAALWGGWRVGVTSLRLFRYKLRHWIKALLHRNTVEYSRNKEELIPSYVTEGKRLLLRPATSTLLKSASWALLFILWTKKLTPTSSPVIFRLLWQPTWAIWATVNFRGPRLLLWLQ